MATGKFKIMCFFYIIILLDRAVWTKEENTGKYSWDTEIINGVWLQDWDTWGDSKRRGHIKEKQVLSWPIVLADG